MKIQSLLKSKTKIVVTSVRLSKLIKDTSTKNFIVEKSIFEKKKKLSDKRIKAFISAKRDSKEGPDLVRIGQGIGGGLGLLGLGRRGGGGGLGRIIGRRPRIPNSPTQLLRMQRGVGGLRSFGRTNVVTNTLLTGLDFRNRKIAGQTNLQAGLGAGGALGGGLLGAAKGAAIGSAILPVGGTLVGGLLGGFLGATAGAGIADSVSGVNSPQFRRKELEKEVQRTTDNTEFTLALNNFDSALLKFREYDDNIKTIILGGGGRNRDGSRIPGFLPGKGGQGATQVDINKAYRRGINVGLSIPLIAIGTAAAVILGKEVIAAGGVAKIGKIVLVKAGKKLVRRQLEKVFRPNLVKTKKLRIQNIKRLRLLRETNEKLDKLRRTTTKIIKESKKRVKELNPNEGNPDGIENTTLTVLNVFLKQLRADKVQLLSKFGKNSSQVRRIDRMIRDLENALDDVMGMRLFRKGEGTKNILENVEEGESFMRKLLRRTKKTDKSPDKSPEQVRVETENALDPLRLRGKGEDVIGDILKRVDAAEDIVGDGARKINKVIKKLKKDTPVPEGSTPPNNNLGAFLPQDMFKNNLNMMDAEATYYSA